MTRIFGKAALTLCDIFLACMTADYSIQSCKDQQTGYDLHLWSLRAFSQVATLISR